MGCLVWLVRAVGFGGSKIYRSWRACPSVGRMNTPDVRAHAETILDALPDHAQSAWRYYFTDGDWMGLFLARFTLLSGAGNVLFAAAVMDNDGAGGVKGSLLVITDRLLARGTFNRAVDGDSPTLGEGMSAVVEAVPLSAVQRVRVDHATSRSRTYAEWPGRLQVTVDLDRDLAGDSVVVIPESNPAVNEEAVRLATAVQALTDAM